MPKGGARVRSGPAPDPGSLRQTKLAERGGWTTLPAGGRQGEPPQWPLTDPSVRELELWGELWGRPQAVMWEAMEQGLEVALFVRLLAEVEEPGASTERRKALRGYLDSLGLSVAGMLRNRWKVAPADEEPELAPPDVAPPAWPSVRDRMKVIEGGAG